MHPDLNHLSCASAHVLHLIKLSYACRMGLVETGIERKTSGCHG